MGTTDKNSVNFTFKEKKYGYMMATKAFHLLGDISSEEPDLCSIYGETKEGDTGYYVGAWVTGFGFFNVLFPKSSTRPLTDEEVEYWSDRKVQIANQMPYGFNKDDLKRSRELVVK